MDDERKGPLIRNAIQSATENKRVITVTVENERKDALDVSKCIIGDKTDKYNKFLKDNGYNSIRAWTVSAGDCKNVSARQALIRLVGVGYFYFDYDLYANSRCYSDWRARGVQKISIGNKGYLPYVGVLIFQHLGFYRDEHDAHSVTEFFNPLEKTMTAKQRSSFYGLLGLLRESIRSKEDILKVRDFAKLYGHHKEWMKKPLLLKYAFETFLHEQTHKEGLLDRLHSRREEGFKRAFLKRAYEDRTKDTLTDQELQDLPFASLIKIIECKDITPEEIAIARAAIRNTKKGLHFPLNKVYYQQSAKGTKIEKMADDIIKQAILDIISVTATIPGRWQERHNEAKNRLTALLNNPTKAQDLINFFQSSINQGAYYKDISSHHQQLKGSIDKSTMINAIDAIKSAAERNKNQAVTTEQYQRKMEPLSDILTMLKSQTDDTATEVSGVLIKSQAPAITDLVDYDTVHCCALFPYDNEDGITGYLEDEHILLLQYFTTGKRGLLTIYGVIICALCNDDKGNTILLVDSAEGDENWLKAMKNWQETYRNCIKQLAKDTEAVGVLYGNNAGNTTPQEFLKYIGQQLGSTTTMNLKKKNNAKRYLETFSNGWSGQANGYYENI